MRHRVCTHFAEVSMSWREFTVLVLRRLYHSSALTLVYAAVLLANIAILVDVIRYPSRACSRVCGRLRTVFRGLPQDVTGRDGTGEGALLV